MTLIGDGRFGSILRPKIGKCSHCGKENIEVARDPSSIPFYLVLCQTCWFHEAILDQPFFGKLDTEDPDHAELIARIT